MATFFFMLMDFSLTALSDDSCPWNGLGRSGVQKQIRSMASKRRTLDADLTWAGGKWQGGQNIPQGYLDYLLHGRFVPLINRSLVLRPFATFGLARANIVLAITRTQHLLAAKLRRLCNPGWGCDFIGVNVNPG
jgi:hypothetical protein